MTSNDSVVEQYPISPVSAASTPAVPQRICDRLHDVTSRSCLRRPGVPPRSLGQDDSLAAPAIQIGISAYALIRPQLTLLLHNN
jgi:hypothetical protein